jgi:hypothetical protein
MEKKTEKKEKNNGLCLKIGFWTMLALFVIMIVFTYLGWQTPSLIAGILFVVGVFFVFVSSIKAIVPAEKSLAYIALAIALMFILYIILAATLSSSSVVG